ncbi:integrase-like protein [Saccharopolyspora dendranthemae]|uniref:Integrase-like protein n=1 Tax=Saccharopolyspora dendranthemae TaxID=1181886 RepID=A0A561U7Q2_9PSEU|nr:phage integrase N-terminal SAM-like domain-containing protein [Saccharopolyspora dendranthemae]TWF95387.1 integrase-like protein [Saccharopolyspora dendranthemae]
MGQLARYLVEHSPDSDADDAAEDPADVTRDHIEAFQAWMIEIRSASTAVNKHKALRVFFGWLLNDEREIDRSPMERARKPATPAKLIPVIEGDVTSQLLEACTGKDFLSLRDQAIIRLFANTGARLSEVEVPPRCRRLGYPARAGAGWMLSASCWVWWACSCSSGDSPPRSCWIRRGLYQPSM